MKEMFKLGFGWMAGCMLGYYVIERIDDNWDEIKDKVKTMKNNLTKKNTEPDLKEI